jgi:hypothetical protein
MSKTKTKPETAPQEKAGGDCPRTPCSASSFTVMKVISSHPEWDEDDGDSEYEVAHFDNKADADEAAKSLGDDNGDATHRAYRHYVRPSLTNVTEHTTPRNED